MEMMLDSPNLTLQCQTQHLVPERVRIPPSPSPFTGAPQNHLPEPDLTP